MAEKMFYTVEETAQKLGVSADEVQQMADRGELKSFRDGDQIMFKREQVEQALSMAQTTQVDRSQLQEDAGDQSADQGSQDSEEEVDEISLADEPGDVASSSTDTIDLAGETQPETSSGETQEPSGQTQQESTAGQQQDQQQGGQAGEQSKSGTATGISIFDADEVEAADPMAQTEVGQQSQFVGGDDDELSLDSVGSGSGLLDLTRESDDTSLGAVELLEEGGEGEQPQDGGDQGGGGLEASPPASSTGIFETAGEESAPAAAAAEGVPAAPAAIEEAYDPTGDGFGGGMLIGVFAVLVVGLIVVLTGTQGLVVDLTAMLAGSSSAPLYALGAFGALCILLSVAGWLIGRARTG